MNHHIKGDNECPEFSINVKGRSYALKIPEDEIYRRTARFEREVNRFKINPSFKWIDRMVTRRRLWLCYRYVEDLFGEGICERYFGANQFDTLEMMRLLQFIADELERARKEREILCKISTLMTERSV